MQRVPGPLLGRTSVPNMMQRRDCGDLRGEGESDAQKAEDGQQAERLAIHDGTSWRGTEGERKQPS